MSLTDIICRQVWDKRWIHPRYIRFLYKRLLRDNIHHSFPFESSFFGHRYKGDLDNTIDFHIFFYGAFEKSLLFFLRDTLTCLNKTGGTFLDVGANVGQHSLFMSDTASVVHAFEPFDPLCTRLQSLLKINTIDNVTVHPVGLGNVNAELPFYAPKMSNLGTGSFVPKLHETTESIGSLKVVIGDDYLAEQKVSSVDLLKIDVEGFERLALEGLQKTLHADLPVIVMEVSFGLDSSFRDEQDIRSLLPENYQLFMFAKAWSGNQKSRRLRSRARRSGAYRLCPFEFGLPGHQTDVICCPESKLPLLPRSS